MKKVLPLVLTFLFSIPVFSQVSEQADSIVWSRFVQGTDSWIPFTKEYLSFNENGQLILSESFNYDTLAFAWKPQNRLVHMYNETGDELSMVATSLNESAWDTNYRYLYYYDDHRNDTLFLQENWNTGENIWMNGLKKRYDYDDQNKMIAYAVILWNQSNAAWDSTMKCQLFYNAQGKDTLLVVQYWYENTWQNTSLERKFYDENGNDTLMLRYGQGSDLSVLTGKVVCEFNESGLRTSETGFSFISDAWNPLFKREYDWTELGNLAEIRTFVGSDSSPEMVLRTKETHYYTINNPVSGEHSVLIAPEVYPNPAHEFLMIRNVTKGWIELFDLNGQKVMDQKISSEQVSVSNILKGFYIYRISNGSDTFSGKIRIE